MRQPFRVAPHLPAAAMKTYQILAPAGTHWRAATCAEVDCGAYLHGWATRVDEATDMGARQAHYIRRQSGRAFSAARDEAGLTVFTFPPGQRCFRASDHRVRLDRAEFFVVRDGDWRGNPRGTQPRQHVRAADWVDDFANHQQALANRLERG